MSLVITISISITTTSTVQFRNKHFPEWKTLSFFVPYNEEMSFIKEGADLGTAWYYY